MKKKIIFIIIIQLVFIIWVSNFGFVKGATDPLTNPFYYKPGGLNNADKIKDMGNIIIGAVQFIGTFTSVIVLLVMGIKYMAGSVEEKAEYKKTMIPYIIGAVLVFATTNILGIVNQITDGIFEF